MLIRPHLSLFIQARTLTLGMAVPLSKTHLLPLANSSGYTFMDTPKVHLRTWLIKLTN